MKEPNVRYQNQGDYQLPCIETKEQKELHIGVWANRHRQYLKQHHRIRYYNLLTSERLYPYLAEIEEQAQTMFSQLVKLLAEKEIVTENLKADNPMLWVQKMNNIRNSSRERVSIAIACCTNSISSLTPRSLISWSIWYSSQTSSGTGNLRSLCWIPISVSTSRML